MSYGQVAHFGDDATCSLVLHLYPDEERPNRCLDLKFEDGELHSYATDCRKELFRHLPAYRDDDLRLCPVIWIEECAKAFGKVNFRFDFPARFLAPADLRDFADGWI